MSREDKLLADIVNLDRESDIKLKVLAEVSEMRYSLGGEMEKEFILLLSWESEENGLLFCHLF